MAQLAIVSMPSFDHFVGPCSRFWRREPSFWDVMDPSTILDSLMGKRMDKSDPMHGLVKTDDGHFQVSLDVKQFSSNELTVKTVNNAVVVHGKHEEKQDENGYISREFTRRYVLPEGVDADTVTSSLSQDGTLLIEASRKALEDPKTNERIVPVITINEKETCESDETQ